MHSLFPEPENDAERYLLECMESEQVADFSGAPEGQRRIRDGDIVPQPIAWLRRRYPNERSTPRCRSSASGRTHTADSTRMAPGAGYGCCCTAST